MAHGFQCSFCRWFNHGGDDFSCFAYPDGVPDDIAEGRVAHDEPRGDEEHNVAFEVLPGFEKRYDELVRLTTDEGE